MKKIDNSQGKIFYGMHFYPGVAEYKEPDGSAFRVFLNEDTLRSMDSTFAGKPVFVDHVHEVEGSVDELRKDADGWVVESFFNTADGKHWVKFIVVSERGMAAIRNGMRLSNAYLLRSESKGGLWNGVEYAKEITAGEFEHLAIVDNPRYEESIILSPEEFKKYNNDKEIELKRIANSKDQNQKGEKTMGLNFFKRTKLENAIDLEHTIVELPKSKKEMTLQTLVNEMDKIVNMHGYASDDHMVKMDNGDEMSVADMKKKMNQEAADKIEAEKAKNAESDKGGEPGEDDLENDADQEGTVSSGEKNVGDRGGDKSLDNADEDEEEKAKKDKKENALKKAKALRNAGPSSEPISPMRIYTSEDGVAKGKARYGSN